MRLTKPALDGYENICQSKLAKDFRLDFGIKSMSSFLNFKMQAQTVIQCSIYI